MASGVAPAAIRSEPLHLGVAGEAVRDLQQRLAALGHDVPAAELGRFGPGTQAAVRSFQDERGLHVDGVCDAATWSRLVEAGYHLGDRLLYHRAPMLHGDDVLELQQRLNRLGFDAGREDGILGPDTSRAAREFQRNAGLAADGICGPAMVATLGRVGGLSDGSVASVRERERLRREPGRLHGRRVYVAVAPELEALGTAIVRGLAEAGAHTVLDASGADESNLAAEANAFAADLCLLLRPDADARCAYFALGSFRSEAGYRAAATLQAAVAAALGQPQSEPDGKTYPVLRETQMAAVVCAPVAAGDAAATSRLVRHTGDLARAIVEGIRRGVEEPLAD